MGRNVIFPSRVLTVVELLDKNIDLNNEKVKNFRFKNYIQIKSICFGYSNDKTTILKNISLNIDKKEDWNNRINWFREEYSIRFDNGIASPLKVKLLLIIKI